MAQKTIVLANYNVSTDENGNMVLTRKINPEIKWVRDMFKRYSEDRTLGKVRSVQWKGTTVIFDTAGNTSITHCDDPTKYSSQTGISIAYAKLKGIPLYPSFTQSTAPITEKIMNRLKKGDLVTFTDYYNGTLIGRVTDIVNTTVCVKVEAFHEIFIDSNQILSIIDV